MKLKIGLIYFISVFLLGIGLMAEDKDVDSIIKTRDTLVEKANSDAIKKLEKIKSSRTKKGDLEGALRAKEMIQKLKGKEDEQEEPQEETADKETKEAKGKNDDVPDVISNILGDSSMKDQIEKRCLEFFASLLENDIDGAYEYVDPQTKNAVQPVVVKGFLKIIAGGLSVAQLKKKDVKISELVIGIKKNEAKVTPSFRVGANWERQKDSYWIKRNGQWYLGDEKQLENFK